MATKCCLHYVIFKLVKLSVNQLVTSACLVFILLCSAQAEIGDLDKAPILTPGTQPSASQIDKDIQWWSHMIESVDSSLEANLFATLAGLVLAIAAFISANIDSCDSRVHTIKVLDESYEPNDEMKSNKLRYELALKGCLLAWVCFVVGLIHSLSLDLAISAPQLSSSSQDIAVLGQYLFDDYIKLKETWGDVGFSSMALAIGIASLCYSAARIFKTGSAYSEIRRELRGLKGKSG